MPLKGTTSLEKLWHLGHVDDINRLTLFVGDDERLRCQVPAVPNGVGQNLPGRTHRYLPGFELVSEVFPFLIKHSLGAFDQIKVEARMANSSYRSLDEDSRPVCLVVDLN